MRKILLIITIFLVGGFSSTCLAQSAISEREQKILDFTAKGMEANGSKVIAKRLFDTKEACKSHLDEKIKSEKTKKPEIEAHNLKDRMQTEGAYAFAVGSNEQDVIGLYCLPLGAKAAYFEAKI